MSDDLSQELRAFEGSEALANGDFSVCIRGADHIETQSARIAQLEAALNQAKKHFLADEPLQAFVEVCAALVGGKDE